MKDTPMESLCPLAPGTISPVNDQRSRAEEQLSYYKMDDHSDYFKAWEDDKNINLTSPRDPKLSGELQYSVNKFYFLSLLTN